MLTIDEIRRNNLKILLKQCFEDSRSQICIRMGMSSAQVSQLFSKHRNIGASIARRFESTCGLPVGWMDTIHQDADEVDLLAIFRSLESREKKKAIEMIKLLSS